MTDKVISLADHVAARHLEREPAFELDDSDVFLLDEGLDLLASYRSITDRETRLRVKTIVDSVSRQPALLSRLHGMLTAEAPLPPPLSDRGPKGKLLHWRKIGEKTKATGLFLALLVSAIFLIEVADPASTDVIASVRCNRQIEVSPVMIP